MDSWSEIQLKKMESGGNDQLNQFLSQYGIPKETDIVSKYNTNAASVYRDRIQTLAEGRSWRDPPVVKESVGSKNKPPVSGGRSSNNGGSSGWDSWDSFDDAGSKPDVRRNQSVGDFGSGGGGSGGGIPARSKSSQDIYTRAQLEASASNKESFFARKMADNDSRPDGLPPSQGGKYVGFGSTPAPVAPRNNSQGDVLSVVSQGFGRLSVVAASAAQSAANVVQVGTKEITSKVREGGYDHKVNETVSVVTAKTTEIGQKTWGIMKGVMALASQKVEEYTREGTGSSSSSASWQRNEAHGNGYYQEFDQDSKGWNNSSTAAGGGGGQPLSGGNFNTVSSASWDDWDTKDSLTNNNTSTKKEVSTKSQNSDSWAGWDDGKDDGFDNFYQSAAESKVGSGHNAKSDTSWTGGGFH
jgi:ADP-ribosylation factor GTPase-activating protein 1